MAKDPVCGMLVDENAAGLRANVRGVTYHFCSESCMREFLAPERELRKLKLGVLISAMLSIPVLAVTYASPFPIQSTRYVLFALDTPIQFIVGWRFYRGTYDSLKSRMGNMDVLIALGTTAAWAYSTVVTFAPGYSSSSGVYFDSSAVIVTLILLGRYLEHVTKNRASAAVRKLTELQPPLVHLLDEEGGIETQVPIERVRVGDVLVVRPGERIPTDSIITEGSSSIDESMITGESIPTVKTVGDEVIGATINRSGLLKLRADKVGQDTTLSQVAKLVEEAQVGRAPIQRLADRVASYFVPLVIATAIAASLCWYGLGHIGLGYSILVFVSIVVISCPCALGIATPAALLVGTSKGAQNGVLFKGGENLEAASKVDTVMFDKTGTITVGRPTVTDIIPVGRLDSDRLLGLAASVETGSEHAMGETIVSEARGRSIDLLEALDFEAVAGRGVVARVQGATVLLGNERFVTERGGDPTSVEPELERLEEEGKTAAILSRDGKVEGVIAVADVVKASAQAAVRGLKELGIQVVMLTGDNLGTATAVAKEVGIEDFAAEATPRQKEERIASAQREGRIVAMVGDGINDAPALAKADVGIAVGSGTDIAKETGGVVLIQDDLRNVVTAIELSRRTLAKIKQNLFWAFAYNVVLIPIAAGALVPLFGVQVYGILPFLAGAAMALSSFTVVSNSLLLLRFKPDLGSSS